MLSSGFMDILWAGMVGTQAAAVMETGTKQDPADLY